MMTTVPIKGVVSSDDNAEIYQFWGYSTVTPSDISDALSNAGGQPIKAEINSPGGDVYAGSDIYTALKNYSGSIKIDIVGLAASAASVIAMAGDTIKISPTGQMMIHRSSTVSQGNSDNLASDLQGLDSTDQAIANVYAEKTGMDVQHIYQMMSDETWINAQDAVKDGFADEIMFAGQPKVVVNGVGQFLSAEVIQKTRSLLKLKNDSNQSQIETSQPKTTHSVADKLAILFGEN